MDSFTIRWEHRGHVIVYSFKIRWEHRGHIISESSKIQRKTASLVVQDMNLIPYFFIRAQILIHMIIASSTDGYCALFNP